MKKLFAVLFAVIIAVTVFAACSKNAETDEDHGNVSETESASVVTTDTAVLSGSKAVDYIKLYTAEELSLSQEDYDNCSYMVASEGQSVEGDYYVKVAVVNKIAHTDEAGNETYTFDSKGEYFIRYDGKRVLKKDMTSDEPKYDELAVKEIPEDLTTTAAAEDTTE